MKHTNLFLSFFITLFIILLIVIVCIGIHETKVGEAKIGDKIIIMGDTLTIMRYEPSFGYYILDNGLIFDYTD